MKKNDNKGLSTVTSKICERLLKRFKAEIIFIAIATSLVLFGYLLAKIL